MPKQAPDFRKQKTKLGKGKQAATNTTNTSFKARSVALPGQSILKDVDENEPHTKRNLTLRDLVIHMKHYSANVRKDGVLGLRELITSYPSVVQPNLSTILDGITKLIVDEDAGVRKALQTTAADLFPRIPEPSWMPYSSILLLFTASGLSHIFPEVRLDSIRFLDILIDFIPEFVTQGWAGKSSSSSVSSVGGRQIIECYLALLSAKGEDKGPSGGSTVTTTANAMFTLSIKSRLVVLKSLSKFLEAALSFEDASDNLPLWPFASAFSNQPSFNAFVGRIRSSRSLIDKAEEMQWQSSSGGGHQSWEGYINGYEPGVLDVGSTVPLDDFNKAIESTISTSSTPHVSQAEDDVLSLSHSLFSVIVSVFIESAPSVFDMSSSAPDIIHFESITSIIEISRDIYGYLSRKCSDKSKIEKELSILIGHMSKYFPFGADFVHKQSMEMEQQLLKLNIVYCELVSCRLLSQSSSKDKNKTNKRDQKLDKATEAQMDGVSDWLSRMLSGTMTTTAQPMGITITPEIYKSLVPTFWALLNLPSSYSAPHSMLNALVEHCSMAGVKSETKTLAVELVARLYILQFDMTYQGSFTVVKNSASDKLLTNWFNSLPKLLWEANNHNLKLTETILDTIQAIMTLDTSDESKNAIGPGLKLFFEAQHPTKGTIPGPWTRIQDSRIHDRGIELAHTAQLASIPSQDGYWSSLCMYS